MTFLIPQSSTGSFGTIDELFIIKIREEVGLSDVKDGLSSFVMKTFCGSLYKTKFYKIQILKFEFNPSNTNGSKYYSTT